MKNIQQGTFNFQEYPSITEKEKTRWSKHVRQLYYLMQDMEWHDKQELLEGTKTGNFQARIHDLRKAGFRVECERNRDIGTTMYRIKEYVGYSTTKVKHCYCFRYNDDYIESKYTG